MLLIIDGYNVIFADPQLAGLMDNYPEIAREKLIQRLYNYSFHRGAKITVVFDGKPGVIHENKSPPGVKVVFSKDISADEHIIKMVESAQNPAEYTVVSSDFKDIGKQVQLIGSAFQTSDEFLAQLEQLRSEHQGNSEKPEEISAEEVDYWLKRFEERK